MADGAATTLSPKEAIALARQYFSELMSAVQDDRVLLEGLSLDDTAGNWVVTFGFDSQRPKQKRALIRGGAIGELVKSMEQFSSEYQEFDLIREFRAIHLSSTDGSFVKLEHS